MEMQNARILNRCSFELTNNHTNQLVAFIVFGYTVLRFHFEYECTFADSFKTACQHQNNAERDVSW